MSQDPSVQGGIAGGLSNRDHLSWGIMTYFTPPFSYYERGKRDHCHGPNFTGPPPTCSKMRRIASSHPSTTDCHGVGSQLECSIDQMEGRYPLLTIHWAPRRCTRGGLGKRVSQTSSLGHPRIKPATGRRTLFVPLFLHGDPSPHSRTCIMATPQTDTPIKIFAKSPPT